MTTFYPPYHFGGDGVYVYRLAEALAARGHKVDVVHSVDAYRLQHPGEPEVCYAHHPGITLHQLESSAPRLAALAAHQLGRPAQYGARLRAVLGPAGRYDVIHFHNISLLGGPGILRLGEAVKLYTAHDYWLVCPTHVLFAFNRVACTERRCLSCTLHAGRPPQLWRHTGLLQRCMKDVDAVVMSSRFALEKHRAEGLQAAMVHLPPPVPQHDPVDEDEPPANDPAPYFLYAGRLEKLKGVHDLIELFKSYREARLVIAGAGSQAGALREQARGLQHVTFLGPVHTNRLGSLYRGAAAALVPSLCYETFGLTAAEVLVHGTPAIVRRLGALTEIIEQTGGGRTFSSLEECRQAMEAIRLEPGLRQSLGQAGRRAAQEQWTVETHVDRYLTLVARLIERRAGPRRGR